MIRSTVDGAVFVCSVPNTRCPVACDVPLVDERDRVRLEEAEERARLVQEVDEAPVVGGEHVGQEAAEDGAVGEERLDLVLGRDRRLRRVVGLELARDAHHGDGGAVQEGHRAGVVVERGDEVLAAVQEI
jgi:hypothetical protein